MLSAITGSTVTIGPALDIVEFCAFRIRLTATDNGVITFTERLASVPHIGSGLRPPLFGEGAPASQTLSVNDPDESLDNAVYADLAGRGSAGQNWRGWGQWAYDLAVAVNSGGGASSAEWDPLQATDASVGRYATFEEAYNAVRVSPVGTLAVKVTNDDFPTGTWDMRGITLLGTFGVVDSNFMGFAENCVFTNLAGVKSLFLYAGSVAGPAVVTPLVYDEESTLTLVDTTLVSVDGTRLLMDVQANLNITESHSTIAAFSGEVMDIGVGIDVVVRLVGSAFADNIVTGNGTLTIQYMTACPVGGGTQAAYSGTVSVNRYGVPSTLSDYVPGTSQQTVFQGAHGFTLSSGIPIPVYYNAGTWVTADLSTPAHTKQAFVVEVVDANEFVIQLQGFHELVGGHGLTDGAQYWSSSVAPYYTATEPSTGTVQVLWVVEGNRLQLLNVPPMVSRFVEIVTITASRAFTDADSGKTFILDTATAGADIVMTVAHDLRDGFNALVIKPGDATYEGIIDGSGGLAIVGPSADTPTAGECTIDAAADYAGVTITKLSATEAWAAGVIA